MSADIAGDVASSLVNSVYFAATLAGAHADGSIDFGAIVRAAVQKLPAELSQCIDRERAQLVERLRELHDDVRSEVQRALTSSSLDTSTLATIDRNLLKSGADTPSEHAAENRKEDRVRRQSSIGGSRWSGNKPPWSDRRDRSRAGGCGFARLSSIRDIDRGAGMTQDIEIRPTGAALGADVQGVDFANLDEATFAAIRKALREHLVLRFRGTALSDADYMALGRRLGEIVPPETHTRTADMPHLTFPR